MNQWIEVLRAECEKASQSKVAATLRQPDGFPSRTVINKVLRGDYNGGENCRRLQALVEQQYMAGEDQEWLRILRARCAKTSQTRVAEELRQRGGFPSPTVINQVLQDKYPSDKGRERLRDLVRGRYMGVTVNCPVLAEIGLDKCAWWQVQPRLAINPLRTQMYRACRDCPNNRNRRDQR